MSKSIIFFNHCKAKALTTSQPPEKKKLAETLKLVVYADTVSLDASSMSNFLIR